MQITDFKFSPYSARNGHRRYRTKIKCPKCLNIRWVDKRNIQKGLKKNNFTGRCNRCQTTGKNHPKYNGGFYISSHGYIGILVSKDDPFYDMKDCRGYIYEHRYNLAKKLGRSLESWEHVHHIDGNKLNNDIDNLELYPNQNHYAITKMQRRIKYLENLLKENKINFK